MSGSPSEQFRGGTHVRVLVRAVQRLHTCARVATAAQRICEKMSGREGEWLMLHRLLSVGNKRHHIGSVGVGSFFVPEAMATMLIK
jgi:hypothetical protein